MLSWMTRKKSFNAENDTLLLSSRGEPPPEPREKTTEARLVLQNKQPHSARLPQDFHPGLPAAGEHPAQGREDKGTPRPKQTLRPPPGVGNPGDPGPTSPQAG